MQHTLHQLSLFPRTEAWQPPQSHANRPRPVGGHLDGEKHFVILGGVPNANAIS